MNAGVVLPGAIAVMMAYGAYEAHLETYKGAVPLLLFGLATALFLAWFFWEEPRYRR